MINAEVTARPGASDATGAVNGYARKQSDEGGKGGFSDALSGIGDGSRKQENGSAEGGAGTQGEVATDADVPSKGRTALELTARVLFGKSGQVEDASGQATVSGKQSKQKADTGTSDTDETYADLLKAKQAGIAAAGKSGQGKSTEKAETKTEDETATPATATASKETALDSVLSLLAGTADIAALAAQRQPAAVRERADGQGRGDKTVGSATDSRAAKASAAAKASNALETSGSDDAAAVEERTFRLSSARAGSQSMDMKIGSDDQGVVSIEAKNAAGGSAENVVVLDSRRFLGFGQSTNGAALTAAMSGDKTWAAAMSSSASAADTALSGTGNVVNTLKLQMNPHDLGSVTATLRLSGDALNVHLTVETHAAMRQLNDDSTGMLDALRSQGFAVDQVTISVVSTAQSDSSGQQQQGQQSGQAGQQAAGHDARQGNGAGREQNQSGSQSSTGEGVRGNNEPVSDTAAGGSARPDQLYL